VVVLVDRDSASSSEMAASAMQFHGCILLGDQTFGKGIGQIEENLLNGTRMVITNNRYYTADGRWLGDAQKRAYGLTPNVSVRAKTRYHQLLDDNDNQVQAAVEFLTKA
jgi:carboxyl-terminal processing protease